MSSDNFEEAVARLLSLEVLLYGGYYEPKSERDYKLAQLITEVLVKVDDLTKES